MPIILPSPHLASPIPVKFLFPKRSGWQMCDWNWFKSRPNQLRLTQFTFWHCCLKNHMTNFDCAKNLRLHFRGDTPFALAAKEILDWINRVTRFPNDITMFTFFEPIKQVLWEKFFMCFSTSVHLCMASSGFGMSYFGSFFGVWALLGHLGWSHFKVWPLWGLATLGFDHFGVWPLWGVVTWEYRQLGVWPVGEVWWEEEDSLLTDNESYANQLAGTPYANIAIQEMRGLHCWRQRAESFQSWPMRPRISLTSPPFSKTIWPHECILTRWLKTVGIKVTAMY